MSYNPCIICGACCEVFRASFYWGECDDAYGKVPTELTYQLTPHRRAMKTISDKSQRCIALTGEVGNCVSCSIYDKRSSVCRDFPYSWENGERNERCDQARAKFGLPPLEPDNGMKAA